MIKRRFSCFAVAFILTLFAFLVVGLLGAMLISLPGRTAQSFGQASPELGTVEHVYLSMYLLLNSDELTTAQDPNGLEQPFTIELGESTASIVNRLQTQGLINNPEAFRNYLHYRGMDTSLQAGEYMLRGSMTPIEIAEALQDATPSEVSFNILPGWRLEEIAENLQTSGLEFSQPFFLQAAAVPPPNHPLSNEIPAGASVEGFLLPGSYRLPRAITADQFIITLLNEFNLQVDSDLRQGFANQGLNLYQAVTLASIVEKETVVTEEMPLIASVFLNRLASGDRLDSDPTVQYALGYDETAQTWWTNPLSLQDLEINSPYNTYRNAGLPPGPISNPSLNALKAVAFPAESSYRFFRATCDGSGRHNFSVTLEEHINNACP